MHTDIPTRADLEHLLSVRDAVCVSIYLPTSPEGPGKRDRIEFKNLAAEALEQLAGASIGRDAVDSVREVLDDLAEDEEFWARQAHSLAVFVTPAAARAFQVANRLAPGSSEGEAARKMLEGIASAPHAGEGAPANQ